MNFRPKNMSGLQSSIYRTETYPFSAANFLASMPPAILFEDDCIADYLLFFAREEHSSDVLEFLIAYRDHIREGERDMLLNDVAGQITALAKIIDMHLELVCG